MKIMIDVFFSMMIMIRRKSGLGVFITFFLAYFLIALI